MLSSPRAHKALAALAQIDDAELSAAARSALSALPSSEATIAARTPIALHD
jgi:hypothetical protein